VKFIPPTMALNGREGEVSEGGQRGELLCTERNCVLPRNEGHGLRKELGLY
jgi:hypothetical protein